MKIQIEITDATRYLWNNSAKVILSHWKGWYAVYDMLWDLAVFQLLISSIGGVKVALYLLFFSIMIRIHTFPMFAIRPMYLTCRAFKKAFNDVIMSRRAINNMNTL